MSGLPHKHTRTMPALASQPFPLLFEIAGFPITAHAAAFVLGAVLAGLLLARRLSWHSAAVWEFVGVTFGVGVLGARAAWLVAYPEQWSGLADAVQIWDGGLVSFGGIGAGVLAAWLWTRRDAPAERALFWNALVPAALMGWAVGRVGNFLMGEGMGTPSPAWDWLTGEVPVPLLEAAGCLAIGFCLWRLRPRYAAHSGLAAYFFLRFLVDFWRDEALVAIGMSGGQIVSLVLLAAILVSWWYARAKSSAPTLPDRPPVTDS